MSVTGIVQANTRDAKLLSDATPMLGGGGGLDVAAVGLRGDEVLIACPMLAELESSLHLLLAAGAEHEKSPVIEGDDSRIAALGGCFSPLASHLNDVGSDGDGSLLPIDVAPAEGEQLTSTGAREEGEAVERLPLSPARFVQ